MTKWLRDWRWHLAKVGFWLIKFWIREQYFIDDDTVQIEEVLAEIVKEEIDARYA